MKYRQLSRDSAHRQALLRNLVTSLNKNESIHTTWPKAKEAQRLAEKLITHAKKNDEIAHRKAQAILYVSCPPSTPTSHSPHIPHKQNTPILTNPAPRTPCSK
jgi:ribosomal protein L17